MDKGLKTLIYIIGGALLFDKMYYSNTPIKRRSPKRKGYTKKGYYREIPYRYMYGTMPRRYKKMKKFSKRLNK